MPTEKWTNNFIGVTMFEKEAKKHKEEFITTYINVGGGLKAADMIGMQKEQSYQEGAEFGYQKGLKAKVNTTTISDCPIKDSWHKQDNDDIYDFIAKDWSLKYFICILKDKSRVTATGICDEDYGGGVNTYLDFDHDDEKYSSEDIVWWKELELPKEYK